MTDAEKLFNETFARWLQVASVVSNFRSTFTAVASSANQHLEQRSTELLRSLFEGPHWAGMLVDSETGEPVDATAHASEYQKYGQVAAKALLESSYASLDAAVLVLYHAILDATVFDYCRVTMLHAPGDWEQDLEDAQVPLLETQNKSHQQLLQAKLNKRLQVLEREPLLAKVDRLFARCNPPAGWSPMTDYVYEGKTIKSFDDQRNEIVRGRGQALGSPLTLFELSDENLFYLQQTGMFFMGLVNFKYHLQIDPSQLQRTS